MPVTPKSWKKLGSTAGKSIASFYNGLVVSRRLDDLIRIVKNDFIDVPYSSGLFPS